MLAAARPDLRTVHFSHTPFAGPDLVRVLPDRFAEELLDGLAGHHACGFHSARWADAFSRELPGDHRPCRPPPSWRRSPPTPTTSAASPPRRPAHARWPSSTICWATGCCSPGSTASSCRRTSSAGSTPTTTCSTATRVAGAGGVRGVRLPVARRAARVPGLPPGGRVGHRRRSTQRWRTPTWEPILSDLSDDYPRSVAALCRYDVLLVNPIRDGLNLVAKEGPLVNERDGLLVLSPEAGAWDELARRGPPGAPLRHHRHRRRPGRRPVRRPGRAGHRSGRPAPAGPRPAPPPTGWPTSSPPPADPPWPPRRRSGWWDGSGGTGEGLEEGEGARRGRRPRGRPGSSSSGDPSVLRTATRTVVRPASASRSRPSKAGRSPRSSPRKHTVRSRGIRTASVRRRPARPGPVSGGLLVGGSGDTRSSRAVPLSTAIGGCSSKDIRAGRTVQARPGRLLLGPGPDLALPLGTTPVVQGERQALGLDPHALGPRARPIGTRCRRPPRATRHRADGPDAGRRRSSPGRRARPGPAAPTGRGGTETCPSRNDTGRPDRTPTWA